MAYKRFKKEEAITPSKERRSIHVGSVNDSIESLHSMCNDKSNELKKSEELNDGEELEVAFFTSDFPELIGVSTITKNESGLLSYSLDFSESTL